MAPAASAQDWSICKSDRFGFAMLVAPGTRWEARDFGNGWGGMHARKGVLETSQVDFAANKTLYEQWYRSLKL